jgi:hypothetical protein
MALKAFAIRHGLGYVEGHETCSSDDCSDTGGGGGDSRRVESIGWAWGSAPDGIQLAVAQAGTERIRFQAHSHQASVP